MEKLIQSFKLIETEDGFHIELKGDNERMRRCVERLQAHKLGKLGKLSALKGLAPRGRRRRFGMHFGPPPWMCAEWHGDEPDMVENA